jgi:hypothetical protein
MFGSSTIEINLPVCPPRRGSCSSFRRDIARPHQRRRSTWILLCSKLFRVHMAVTPKSIPCRRPAKLFRHFEEVGE